MWKDWVIIITTLLILLILVDGFRRKRNERNGNIKVSRALKKSLKQQPEYEEEVPTETPSYTTELPNGGARVVGQRDPSIRIPSIEKKPQAKSYLEKHQHKDEDEPKLAPRTKREPQQTSLNLGQSVPMLMESVDDSKARTESADERIEPGFSASRDDDLDDEYDDRQNENGGAEDYEGEDYERDDHPYTRELEDDEERNVQSEDESDYAEEDEQDLNPEDDDQYEDDEYSHEDDEDDVLEEDYEDESQSSSAARANSAEKQPAEPEEVLIINVMAHKGEMFKGGELLDIILQCGMRYGNMDIFHRHSDTKGE